jgi:two-component sensor histidine kinase
MATILATEFPPAEGRLFLAELLHRINNEYAAAISMLSVAAARTASEEARAALDAVRERLHDYARVHRALQMPHQAELVDVADAVREVCRSITRSKLESMDITLTLVEQPFAMDADRCWRLCLIVSELVTNSVRHAFGRAGGAISVEVRQSGPFVVCRVSDNGCSASPPRRGGRGLAIIEGLVRSLDGSIKFRFGPSGSCAVLAFPRSMDDAGAIEAPSALTLAG